MNSYQKGRTLEYAVIHKLKREGYRFFIRSAGSKGAIDVLASNGMEILAIQAKKNGYLTEKEKNRLLAAAEAFKAKPCLAYKKAKKLQLKPLA